MSQSAAGETRDYCLHLVLDTSPQSAPGGDARKPGCCTAIVAPEALRTNHPPPLSVGSFCTFAARTRLGHTFQGRLHKIPWHRKRLDDLGCDPLQLPRPARLFFSVARSLLHPLQQSTLATCNLASTRSLQSGTQAELFS